MDAAQRLNADDIIGDIQVNIIAQTHLIGIGGAIAVRATAHQSAFRPLRGGWPTIADVERRAGLFDNVPKLIAARSITQVNLKPALFGPARTLHGNRNSVDFTLCEPKILQIMHPVAKD